MCKGGGKYWSLLSLSVLPCNISASSNLARLCLDARNMTNIQISPWNFKHRSVAVLVKSSESFMILGVHPSLQQHLTKHARDDASPVGG